MIKSNAYKYSVSAMCRVLKIPRSTYYYESKVIESPDEITPKVIDIFRASRNNYGTRKIKVELKKQGFVVSRRKIGKIMKVQGLVSKYTVAQYKPHIDKCNESKIANELNREFNSQTPYAVVVSDLTYVRVKNQWNYVCILVDLFNREIIGYSAGPYKDANLVYSAFASVRTRLDAITLFHTDRGNEFKNKVIDEVLETFKIKRSLSLKGCPYDNAVAEATFKIFKTEFTKGYLFDSLQELQLELSDYINWFNNIRIHSTLGYLSPKQYKEHNLKKTV
ncbi:Transposase InsO and inactivated derivatives [Anaerovirgula multivorans]|uniref:Transposase InsO and inactivated derivatives n=1 Tax=Anaerovirgula multivorans TaxID=312168 RepID=A0A239LRC1_9FIRM|nr:Transposase InsO and inactivated derivatives [Anaerovirgula multivorans]